MRIGIRIQWGEEVAQPITIQLQQVPINKMDWGFLVKQVGQPGRARPAVRIAPDPVAMVFLPKQTKWEC